MQRIPKTKRRNSFREVDPIDYWFFIRSHKTPRQHQHGGGLVGIFHVSPQQHHGSSAALFEGVIPANIAFVAGIIFAGIALGGAAMLIRK